MKILVTGGAGFIGSSLIKHIINETDDNIINIDKLTYAGNLASLEDVNDHDRYQFEQIDICNISELRRIFNHYQPDSVMHLAAESHVDKSINNPSDFIDTNIIGTYNLLEVSREYFLTLSGAKTNIFRFHHISTDEVYGDLKMSGGLFTEDTPYSPSSPYSASKASSDHLVRAWHKTYKLPVIITNCSNNYGPNQYPEKLIPLVILNALEGKNIPIYGDGKQIRDWLYVEDHAKALIKVIRNGVIGETYNIGGHNEITNLEVVNTICSILDEVVPLKNGSYLDQIIHVSDRKGHDQRYAIDATKIKRELGWMPQEDFNSGIMKTIYWYLNNKSWSKKIRTHLGKKKST